jgi:hypothetical protein
MTDEQGACSMKYRSLIFILAGLLFFGAVSQAQSPTDEVLHVVISVDGDAYVAHFSAPGNFSGSEVLTAGSFVKTSDVIEAGPGSRVVILCANRVTDEISNDVRNPTCAPDVAPPLVTWNNVEIYGQQRAAADDIVYVTSPRHTMLLSNKPSIEWIPIPNAEERGITYRVTLYNVLDNSIVWEVSGIKGSRLDYPPDQQPLAAVDPAEHPIRYQFVVTPIVNDQELRNFDPMRPEGFCIVSARHRPGVEQAVNELAGLSLPDDVQGDVTRSFYLAVYYHGQRLYSDALNELLKILPVPLDEPFPPEMMSAQSITGSPSYYILLGNVLYAQRLPMNQVEPAYRRAQEIALALNDTVALATINEQLGDILRGRKTQITQETDPEIYNYYASALEYYTALQDQAAVERITQTLQSQPQVEAVDLCQP